MQPGRPLDLGTLDGATAAFLDSRSRLFGIAYRMLGTVAEAEDIVQETWLRWQMANRSAVLEPTAYLVSVTTRLSINVSQSARSRRETYIGPWLPEPVDTGSDPTLGAERGEALELAVMLLLEKLPPAERAAYVLREAFNYYHRQNSEVLETTEGNVRQIVTRARKHIAGERSTCSSGSSKRPCTGREVHRGIRFALVDRRHNPLDRSKWKSRRTYVTGRPTLCSRIDRRVRE